MAGNGALLKDLIEIPEAVHHSDFVISLADGIDRAAATVDSYVVTDQLLGCFDRALSLVESVVSSRTSKGAYLHGSFGSGKSHFMAVLHLLLEGDPRARSKPELGEVVARYDGRLRGRRFLLVPYHMIGAASMEAGVLGGYVEHVRRLHPGASLPHVYLDDELLAGAQRLRAQMGDEAFFANLGGGGDDEGFGSFAQAWDAARFDGAAGAPAGSPERAALVSDYIDAYAPHTRTMARSTGEGFVPLGEGLSAISRHAKELGYDAVVLFLDELILWFASWMADPNFVNREGPKVAKLVEAPAADRPAPIASFIARQRDLRDFIGQGVPGAERLNFAHILQFWEGRFDTIELSDTNLRAIVEQRLLRPRDEASKRVLDDAFERVAARAGSALDTLMTSDADRAAFRRVYPFSPALIETLVAVSGYLQRERTALRLLLQLLVDRRDTLSVGDLVPLGDLYDVIRTGEEPFSDELKRHFVRARDLYQHRLRRILLEEHGLEEAEADDVTRGHPFRTDDRLVKTLLLAALVPTVGPLQGLTVRRLADLNHGTIVTPVPGAEKSAVLGRLKKWQPEVPELRVEGDAQDPTVSLQLTGVDVQGILDQASHVDNLGARRGKIRDLLAAELGVDLGSGLFPAPHTWVWRGSRRSVDVRFANVRDPTDVPDSEFRAVDRPRIFLDFPFDPGHAPADDLARMGELREEGPPGPTVAWLPRFLTGEGLDRLGRLVVLDYLTTSEDRLATYTAHLSPQDRVEAGHLLRHQAESVRGHVRELLRQAYGLEKPDERWIRTELPVYEAFPALDPGLEIRPPSAASLRDAFHQVLARVMAHLYPAHPEFEDLVSPGDLRTALAYVEKAVGERNQRLEGIPVGDRKPVRKVLGPLRIATTGEAHIVLGRHWRDHFHRKQEQSPGAPVTVERLKRWIDEPTPMGLDDRVANLVVSSYTLADDRVLIHGGRPVEPTVDRLEPTTEVRTQKLPDEAAWVAARPRAQAVFGVDASPIRSAANVSALAERVREAARPREEGCRRLLNALTAAAPRAGADGECDRLRTARVALELVEAVVHGSDLEVVEALAGVRPPTSEQALGRSIAAAADVAEALSRVQWDLFGAVADLPEGWRAKGEGIRDRVRAAFERDELAVPLARKLEDEAGVAARLLKDLTRLEPPKGKSAPETPPPDGLPAEGRRSGDDAKRVLPQLQARADELETLEVTWKLRGP